MKLAIVGSGVSGLVAAHLLRHEHEVTVFEADTRIGGHANTLDVEIDGERHGVDTGFIVYNERTYPGFTRLLAQLGVETRPSDMSFGSSCERTGLEWASPSLSTVFAQRRNLLRPAFLRMLRDVVRFGREAPALLEAGDEKVSLGDYLCGAGYGRELVEHYVVPMGASIWSAPPEEFLRFPAAGFVRFFANHGLLDRRDRIAWRVVAGGSRRYVEALVAPFRERIRTGCPVHRVVRRRDGVELFHAGGGAQRFDRVVLAVHSDQALRMLGDASELERRVLGAIRYQENEAVLHTDRSVMPRCRRAWASWNHRTPREPRGRVFVTYHMNRLQGLRSRHDFLVTLNGSEHVDPARVIERISYHHPVFDARAMEAQKLHGAIDGAGGVHFCGAWWGYGFHEDGVKSALAVCRSFGRELPA
jgi:predicted NAD/FAD-binding protein